MAPACKKNEASCPHHFFPSESTPPLGSDCFFFMSVRTNDRSDYGISKKWEIGRPVAVLRTKPFGRHDTPNFPPTLRSNVTRVTMTKKKGGIPQRGPHLAGRRRARRLVTKGPASGYAGGFASFYRKPALLVLIAKSASTNPEGALYNTHASAATGTTQALLVLSL